MKIKEWAIEDRPREKMMARGIEALTDAELLAILIGSGNSEETAVQLCMKILADYNNDLNLFGKITLRELTTKAYKGIGEAKAITILSAIELGRRRESSEITKRMQVSSSKDVYSFFKPHMADLPHEEFWVLFLNHSNKVIRKKRISQGGIAETSADIRMILKDALQLLTCSMILCHNHPSGNNKPSSADEAFTRKITEAAKLMDIRVLDHIIVCEDSYYSFADNGKI